jgi:hypothetical protein
MQRRYAGEVLKMTPGTTTTVIEAIYHFNGPAHSFTALVHVEQTGLKAVISGVVTEGWLKGSQAKGEYTQITTSQAPGGRHRVPGHDRHHGSEVGPSSRRGMRRRGRPASQLSPCLLRPQKRDEMGLTSGFPIATI